MTHLTVYAKFTIKDAPRGEGVFSLRGEDIHFGKGGWTADQIVHAFAHQVYEMHGLWQEPDEMNESLNRLRAMLANARMGPPEERDQNDP